MQEKSGALAGNCDQENEISLDEVKKVVTKENLNNNQFSEANSFSIIFLTLMIIWLF